MNDPMRRTTGGTPVASGLRRRPLPRRPKTVSRWQNLPVSLKFGLPLLLLGLAVKLVLDSLEAPTTLTLLGTGDRPVPMSAARLEFYPYTTDPFAPVPRPRLAELSGLADGPLELPGSLPDEVLVKVSAPDHGTGFVRISRDGRPHEVLLGVPVELAARVVGPPPASEPAEGAEVLVTAGEPSGVPLFEGRADAAGRFTVTGLSDMTARVWVRIRYPGAAILEKHHTLARGAAEFQLVATEPITGRIDGPDDLPWDDLRVAAYRISGTAVPVAGAERTFRIDNVSPDYVPRLVVRGLPEGWTHRAVSAAPGDRDIVIEVRRAGVASGRVVDAETGSPMADTRVGHAHGPNGDEWVRSDGSGRFTIGRLPLGPVELFANASRPERRTDPNGRPFRVLATLEGRVDVVAKPGAAVEGVTIAVR